MGLMWVKGSAVDAVRYGVFVFVIYLCLYLFVIVIFCLVFLSVFEQ